jgi:hypothetical protein
VVTIVGSIIILRIVQSPTWNSSNNSNSTTGKYNSTSSFRNGRKAQRGRGEDDAEPASAPALMGNSKLSKQLRNPPLVLRSALSDNKNKTSNNNNFSTTHSTTHSAGSGNDHLVTMGASRSTAVGRKAAVLQFGAAAGWEDDDDEFKNEFSYQRCSTAATLHPRGPAYRGRTSKRNKSGGNGSPASRSRSAGEALSDPD